MTSWIAHLQLGLPQREAAGPNIRVLSDPHGNPPEELVDPTDEHGLTGESRWLLLSTDAELHVAVYRRAEP